MVDRGASKFRTLKSGINRGVVKCEVKGGNFERETVGWVKSWYSDGNWIVFRDFGLVRARNSNPRSAISNL